MLLIFVHKSVNNFRPYYLYFLDRELLTTLGLYEKLPLKSVLHDIVMCLLTTPFPSYCSLSLIFESEYAYKIYYTLLPAFQGGHIILNMSGAKSLFLWVEEKRSQYEHSDKQRYFRYMADDWEKITATAPTIHWRKIDTTVDLSNTLSEYITSEKYKGLILINNKASFDNESSLISNYLLDSIHERGKKAITKELFKKTYQRYGVSAKTRTAFDLSVSFQYISSQIKEFDATIPVNGQLPIH